MYRAPKSYFNSSLEDVSTLYSFSPAKNVKIYKENKNVTQFSYFLTMFFNYDLLILLVIFTNMLFIKNKIFPICFITCFKIDNLT